MIIIIGEIGSEPTLTSDGNILTTATGMFYHCQLNWNVTVPFCSQLLHSNNALFLMTYTRNHSH